MKIKVKTLNELTKDELSLRASALSAMIQIGIEQSWRINKLEFIDDQWMRLSEELQGRE